jgi:hypothetical protein
MSLSRESWRTSLQQSVASSAPIGGPVTLGDLVRSDKLLWVCCCDCGHERDVNPAMVPLPAETPVPEVGKHMKCSACGSRKINTKPELYPGGVEAMRKRRL